ncbi:hypothetical protein NO263_03420 [Gluconacetobacter entanii]|uniref:Uncharacterized protein n=3 Tax=Acetobacteraceae TaxID=433 RepID=A0ABQ0SFP9_NOVHA|nr:MULTISPECIES: hypothetical protein [Acetobacteraceae]MCW4589625.1 hypothetical protein [Gluconacetobacter entanii]MCW4592923.1 hypothetical protein [Gluconacetobacter entanii]NPC89169.1 hypothetical protein [Gluconacetobacter entanii]GAN83814.1 hypothetical protein Gaha_0105_049 [Novacetimonas hansenii JCM 7643]GEC64124.1 hypothetical protein GHA01_19730 [Novacetimonas hansenii]
MTERNNPTQAATEISGMLGSLGERQARIRAADQAILSAAQNQLVVVERRIESARMASLLSDEGRDRFLDLIRERGKLLLVIADAQAALEAAGT